MSNNAYLKLKIDSLIKMHEHVNKNGAAVQEAFYTQYKNAVKLSLSNHFRGEAADSFKNYLKDGAINIIAGFMDVAEDLTLFMQVFAEAFYLFEAKHSGVVGEYDLFDIAAVLRTHEEAFDGERVGLNNVLADAAQYISTQPLNMDDVNYAYNDTHATLNTIRNKLNELDAESICEVRELMARIQDLKGLIKNVSQFCYDENGRMIPESLDQLSSQAWFCHQSNMQLLLMLQESPFEYSANEVTYSEEQWSKGWFSDVYIYAGYSILSRSYEKGRDDGNYFLKAKFAVAQANFYAQFTDYVRAQADVKAGYAEADVKVGISDKYIGVRYDLKAGIFRADASAVVGSEDINAYAKGKVRLLCADFKVATELQKDGQFAIGVDTSATLASASGEIGFSFLRYKPRESATGKPKNLFGLSAGVKANAGGSGVVWLESKAGIETKYVNFNALSLNLDLSCMAGGNIEITIPQPYIKNKIW